LNAQYNGNHKITFTASKEAMLNITTQRRRITGVGTYILSVSNQPSLPIDIAVDGGSPVRYYTNPSGVLSVPIIEGTAVITASELSLSGGLEKWFPYTNYPSGTPNKVQTLNLVGGNTYDIDIVYWTEHRYHITASAGAGATISPSGTIDAIWISDQHVGASGYPTLDETFYYNPNSGYKISSLKVDGNNVAFSATGGSYTIKGIVANHTISVTAELE
jgi:hypothetical protein